MRLEEHLLRKFAILCGQMRALSPERKEALRESITASITCDSGPAANLYRALAEWLGEEEGETE